MNKYFQLSKISEYRTELLGMSAFKDKKTINLLCILLLAVNGLLIVLLTCHLVYGYFFLY